ncbi:MAG: hypothetical protein IPJ19_19085, partial [Planctomycetes bacterium]|nr:hypothetical protein [Planctomycetota bacterium]
ARPSSLDVVELIGRLMLEFTRGVCRWTLITNGSLAASVVQGGRLPASRASAGACRSSSS